MYSYFPLRSHYRHVPLTTKCPDSFLTYTCIVLSLKLSKLKMFSWKLCLCYLSLLYVTLGLIFCYLYYKDIHRCVCMYRWICSFLNSLISLQERENLSSLERKYCELTGGQAFPLNPVSMKEVLQTNSTSKEETKLRNDKKSFFQYWKTILSFCLNIPALSFSGGEEAEQWK